MRAPFPLALRIGTDIVATNRISSLVQPDIRRLVRLANRFLLPQELEDLRRRFPHWQDADRQDQLARRQLAAWIAGRWASKEAAKKAWNASLLSFRDLRVGIESDGAVHVVCDTRLTTPTTSDHSIPSTSTSTTPSEVTEQTAQLSISTTGTTPSRPFSRHHYIQIYRPSLGAGRPRPKQRLKGPVALVGGDSFSRAANSPQLTIINPRIPNHRL
ncbi:hypothetical protein CLAIMM_01608 [Cladophialophora immunda]|nr:hypothetical protein CLAIMM_01608 [Cladophialophora immunda]